MAGPTVGLLTFNRNDPRRTLDLLRRLSGNVTEAVVVDSSDLGPWRDLEAGLQPPRLRAIRAIPTGYADLVQPTGVAALTTDWVFYCDPDEEPSPGLLHRVAHPEGADAYVVPRWEQSLRAYTPHLRLYRREVFVPSDPAYAFPGIRGVVKSLPRSERLIHHRDYRMALAADYRTRVMDLESLERPVDGVWFRSVLPGSHGSRSRGSSQAGGPTPVIPISPVAAAFAAGVSAARALLQTGSLPFSTFQWRYHRARAQFQAALSREEQDRRAHLTRSIRGAGGMIRFLGFDRSDYVRDLTATFTWDMDGLEVLHRLLAYRLDRGHPMPAWTPDPSGS
jgi:hypothetical protein